MAGTMVDMLYMSKDFLKRLEDLYVSNVLLMMELCSTACYSILAEYSFYCSFMQRD